MLFQTGIVPFFWLVESIKIKVIETIPRNYVKFNQCVGRALYRPDMTERAQEAADQRGLARPEFAVEVDDKTRNQHARQRSTQRKRCRFVGQRPVHRMMRRMILR